jgi:hypothetical protein
LNKGLTLGGQCELFLTRTQACSPTYLSSQPPTHLSSLPLHSTLLQAPLPPPLTVLLSAYLPTHWAHTPFPRRLAQSLVVARQRRGQRRTTQAPPCLKAPGTARQHARNIPTSEEDTLPVRASPTSFNFGYLLAHLLTLQRHRPPSPIMRQATLRI